MSHCPNVPRRNGPGRWDTGTGLRGFFGFGFEFDDDAAHAGLGKVEFFGDLTHGFALLVELANVLEQDFLVLLGVFAKVGILACEIAELEVDVTAGMDDLVEHDVVGAVAELAGADFQLLDVAKAGVLGRLADGEDGIKEVVELLGTGQVVLGDGAIERALGCVGDDQQRPAIALLEVHQFHHEDAGVDAFVGGIAQVGQVVDDRHFAAEPEHRLLDVGEDLLFVVGYVEGERVDLSAVEACGELVQDAGVGVAVAQLELLVGELAVDQQDVLPPGDVLGHLDSEDGLAQVGVGEQAADLALVPELLVEGRGVGPAAGIGDGAVGRLDGEHADVVGCCRALDLVADGLDGVLFHGRQWGLVLVAEDGTGLDGFVEVVGVDEGLAFDLENDDLALLGQAVESGGTNV